MKVLSWPGDRAAIEAVLAADRGGVSEQVMAAASAICDRVRSEGFGALAALTREFHGVGLASASDVRVSASALDRALAEADPRWLAALGRAGDNIDAYHRSQLAGRRGARVTGSGFTLTERIDAVPSVAVYVPAGEAPLVSSLLMNVIPAQVAGVERIAVATSLPRGAERPAPGVLAAAAMLGIDEVYCAHGPGLVAALAYGDIVGPPVDKVVGPGGAMTTAVKKLVSDIVGTDALAGPSEVVVLADDTAAVDYVMADLLAQAEHAGDEAALLITTSPKLAKDVAAGLEAAAAAEPRADIIKKSLSGPRSGVVLAPDADTALQLANRFAPEHCVIMMRDADAVAERLRHCGCVFVGSYSPVSLGDFYCGTNHVLPTGGAARFQSPLGVDDFLVRSSVVRYDAEALAAAADDVVALAEGEGLPAHARAVTIRRVSKGEAGGGGGQAGRKGAPGR